MLSSRFTPGVTYNIDNPPIPPDTQHRHALPPRCRFLDPSLLSVGLPVRSASNPSATAPPARSPPRSPFRRSRTNMATQLLQSLKPPSLRLPRRRSRASMYVAARAPSHALSGSRYAAPLVSRSRCINPSSRSASAATSASNISRGASSCAARAHDVDKWSLGEPSARPTCRFAISSALLVHVLCASCEPPPWTVFGIIMGRGRLSRTPVWMWSRERQWPVDGAGASILIIQGITIISPSSTPRLFRFDQLCVVEHRRPSLY